MYKLQSLRKQKKKGGGRGHLYEGTPPSPTEEKIQACAENYDCVLLEDIERGMYSWA